MRRSLVLASAVALVTVGTIGASADAPVSLYPKAGCNVFTDPAGDASLVGPDPSSNNFDITGVSYRLSADTFTTVIRVPGLKEQALRRGTGDTWISRFTVNKHAVVVTVSRFSPIPVAAGIWDSFNPIEYLDSVTVDGTDIRATGVVPGGEFDGDRGLVMLSLDRTGLEKAVKAPLGDLTALEVEADTRIGYSVEGVTALDVATAPAKQVQNAEDNGCFI